MFTWLSLVTRWFSRKQTPRRTSWPFLSFESSGTSERPARRLSINLPVTQEGTCGYCGYPISYDGDGEPYCFACRKGLEEIGYGGGPDPTSY